MVTSLGTLRAVGYCRVSTPEQAGERHSSLDTQESRIRRYCQDSGQLLLATFTDVLSGRRDDRVEYRRMVDLALADGADLIVVQWLDRFGRNPREILRRIWELQDRGVTVVATDEDIKEELVLLMRAGLAGAESRRTSERVKVYMSASAAKGVHFGRPPYGYRAVKTAEGTAFEQDPDEAAAVLEMYRLSVEENFGYKRIADRMHEMGHPTREGRQWAAYTVQHILTNEAIAGTLVYGKRPKRGIPASEPVRVEGFFPAILSHQQWNSLQERLAIRREMPRGTGHKSDFLLTGIARCGHCGGPMVGKHGAMYRGRRYKKYYCSRAQRSRAKCATYNGHSAPKLEAAVLEYLGQFSDPAKVRQHLLAYGRQEAKRHLTELKRVEQRLTRLERDFRTNLDLLKRGVLDEHEFMAANQDRRDERTSLESTRAELAALTARESTVEQTADALPGRIKSFLENLQGLDARRAKALLQPILKTVHVYRDNRIEVEFRVSSGE